jgi:hypothetical protein
MNRLFSRTALLTAAFTTLAFAQMGGGMGPGNSSNPGTTGMNSSQGMVSGMGSTMGMSGAMGSREMMDGPTIGPDGTVYVVRHVSASTTNQGMMPPSTGASKYELVAISAVNGAANWKLDVAGTMVSEPVLAKDGKIFMTASDFVMNGKNQSGGGMMNPGTATATARKSRLIVVTANSTSASISSTIEMDSDVLSAPKVSAESADYSVYVTGFEMGVDDKDTVASGQKTLYAFTSAASLKFSVKINQP